ncbi:porin [Trinickia soli]|uniref:Porin n=1 Tax=Trinickia soli TaxID=380675 RepID=A0A2N7VGN1_9BURK|nr:porin [Trinickia soli]KAA0079291.1 porin [Paraburkholderia sp. T12-10]PMS16299.1 porin [Trinickia soli]
MNKRILVAAVLGSIGVAAHAQSSVTLYGLIDAGVSYVNNSSSTVTGHSNSLTKYDDGVAQGSRWGLKGSEDLGNGLKAIFTLENGFNSGNGTLSQNNREFGRQAFVGLTQAGTGSVTFGRQYSLSTDVLANYTTGGNTVAGNYAFHINDIDQLTSSRIDNSVKFTSANFAGVTFGALYGFSNHAGAFAGAPTTGTGAAAVAGSARTYSFGLNYAAGPFGVGAAYTDIRFPSQQAGISTGISNAVFPAANIKELRTFGLGGRYLMGPATFWALWTNTRLVQLPGTGSSNLVFNAYEAGAKYAVTPAFTAGLGYTYMNLSDAAKGHFNQVDLSLDYALSKRTDVYVLGIYQKASGNNNGTALQAQIGDSTGFFGTSGVDSQQQVAARVGIRHKF